MTTQPQPLDTTAIQAALTLLGTAPWRTDGPEIYTDDPDSPHASTWIGETCSIELPDGGAARAEAIVTVHNALPALLAHVADLEQQLAQYVGHEPTIAEEMAELTRRLDAVDAVCDAAEQQTATRGTNLPRWVATVRAARHGAASGPAARR